MMGMTDLGGILDILASFRPGEGLLLDLVMEPDEVNRLVWEIHELWHQFYNELHDVLLPVNPGYISWGGIFSDKPSYMLQSDFAYMIGPKMFDQFVKPELTATCQRLDRSFYHLDGTGQLPHVDSLLSIDELNGIQWIFGAQEEKGGHLKWLDLYKRIYRVGKKVQLYQFYGFDQLDAVINALRGDSGAIHYLPFMESINREDELCKGLRKYGI